MMSFNWSIKVCKKGLNLFFISKTLFKAQKIIQRFPSTNNVIKIFRHAILLCEEFNSPIKGWLSNVLNGSSTTWNGPGPGASSGTVSISQNMK